MDAGRDPHPFGCAPRSLRFSRWSQFSLSRMHLDGATSRGSSPSPLVEGSDDRKEEMDAGRDPSVFDLRMTGRGRWMRAEILTPSGVLRNDMVF